MHAEPCPHRLQQLPYSRRLPNLPPFLAWLARPTRSDDRIPNEDAERGMTTHAEPCRYPLLTMQYVCGLCLLTRSSAECIIEVESTGVGFIGPEPKLDDRALSTELGKVDHQHTLTRAIAHVSSCHHDNFLQICHAIKVGEPGHLRMMPAHAIFIRSIFWSRF